MNSKTTKRALLSSAVALLVCFTMLLSTTFAWFTDTAVSGSNVIVSGKLDVALIDANDASLEGQVIGWATKDGRAQNEILWEPGCTYETEPFYVKNNGNLALKYQVVINGIEGDAKLLEAIEWTVTVGDATTALADLKGELLAGASTGAIVLSGHMKEDAGNEYQDLSVNGISVSVFATQLDAESDSFGPDYDEDAVYGDYFVTDAAALADAFANAENGDVIAIMADMDIAPLTLAKDRSLTINLNGHTLTAVSAKDSGNQWAFQVKGNLAVVGNGTVTMNHTGADMGWGALSAAFSVEGGTLTLGEGVVVVHKGGTSMAYGVDVNSTLGTTTLNIDGAIISSSYIGVRLFNNHQTAKAIANLNSGVVDGSRRDIWVHNPSARAVDANGVVNFADGYVYTETVQDASSFYGRIYDFTTSVAVVDDPADLTEAVKNSDLIVLQAGEYTLPAGSNFRANAVIKCEEGTVFTGNSKLNINGATIEGATFSNPNGTAADQTINGTFKDCTFTGTNGLRWCYAGETVVFENCVFSGDVYGAHFDGGANDVVFKNCTFSGFNAIGGAITLATYEGCTFVANDTSSYNGINLWGDSVLTNCTFVFDGSVTYEWAEICGVGKTATFTGCVITDGTTTTPIVAANEYISARTGASLVFN